MTPKHDTDPYQVVQHGGRAEAMVTAETTHLVVLLQPAGAPVTAAALLEAMCRSCGDDGAQASVAHLRSRLASGRLQMVSATCAAERVLQPPSRCGQGRGSATCSLLTLNSFTCRPCK